MVGGVFMGLGAILMSLVIVVFGWFLGKRSLMDREKSSPFECGFDPVKSARLPFSLRFFLLAIIFLVFDVEVVLLFPMLVGLFKGLSFFSVGAGGVFLVILIIGLFYEWGEGALDWGA